MPVQPCRSGGRPGWKYGEQGHCYGYTAGDRAASGQAKRRAYLQGSAISARTGEPLTGAKFNTNHDPETGRFDFGSGGSVEARALGRYGVTRDWRKAGFILRDGRMLDFSEGQPYRSLDHRNVEDLVTVEPRAGLPRQEGDRWPAVEQFMKDTGAIRFMPELPAATVRGDVTPEQLRVLSTVLNETRDAGGDMQIDSYDLGGVVHVFTPRQLREAVAGKQPAVSVENYRDIALAIIGERAAALDPAALSRIFSPEAWAAMRQALLPTISRLFREAFMEGAQLASRQRPSRRPLSAGLREALDLMAGLRQPPEPLPILPFDFDAVNTAADRVIAAYSDAWWQQFSAATQRSLRQIIADAQTQGLTLPEVIDRVEPLFGARRATNIAVSELTNLLGMGAQETYRAAGFQSWEWRTVRDARVDDVCFSLDGQQFPIEMPFERAHPQCRCWPVPAGVPAFA